MAASRKPRKRAPASPMKMSAGCRLCTRKPPAAPATRAAMAPTRIWPWRAAATISPAPITVATVLAQPSMLSSRLNELGRTTSHAMVSSQSTGPPNRWTRAPAAHAAEAATSSAARRSDGRRVRTSSTSPIVPTSNAPARSTAAWPSQLGRRGAAPTAAMAMATPPRYGVATRWTLPLPGAAVRPRAMASRRMSGTSPAVATKAMAPSAMSRDSSTPVKCPPRVSNRQQLYERRRAPPSSTVASSMVSRRIASNVRVGVHPVSRRTFPMSGCRRSMSSKPVS